MKASHFLICLSAFTVILACDSNTDIRLAQTFTFAVNMQGSDQRPDPDFETLVTHIDSYRRQNCVGSYPMSKSFQKVEMQPGD